MLVIKGDSRLYFIRVTDLNMIKGSFNWDRYFMEVGTPKSKIVS